MSNVNNMASLRAKFYRRLLPGSLLQIVFYEDRSGMNTKIHPSTTRLCTELSENIPVLQGRSASMTLLEQHISRVWQVIVRLSQDLKT